MVKRWLFITVPAIVLFILLDLFLAEHHVHFPWSGIPGFFSLFGVIGCLLLIGISKALGTYWLQRKEDYYERDDDDS